MGIERIDEELCNGCELCVDSCPTDVLRFDRARDKAYIRYAGDCTVRYLCEMDCPTRAIFVSPRATHPVVLPY